MGGIKTLNAYYQLAVLDINIHQMASTPTTDHSNIGLHLGSRLQAALMQYMTGYGRTTVACKTKWTEYKRHNVTGEHFERMQAK